MKDMERHKEKTTEMHKLQQKENAARIIEFSTKNAKISSELVCCQEEINVLGKEKVHWTELLQATVEERDDWKGKYTTIYDRLQLAEDNVEEMTMKMEASEGEIQELAHAKEAAQLNFKKSQEMLTVQHAIDVENTLLRCKSEADKVASQTFAVHKQALAALESDNQKIKESFHSQVKELHQQQNRDTQEYRQKSTAYGKALEHEKRLRQEECDKNAALTQELAALREDSMNQLQTAYESTLNQEREVSREKTRLLSKQDDLQDQLKDLSALQNSREQVFSTMEQQLNKEREARFGTLQKLRQTEDACDEIRTQNDDLNHNLEAGKKQMRDLEKMHRESMQAKELEIERLVRRNAVLEDSITRFTSAKIPSPTGLSSTLSIGPALSPESNKYSQSIGRGDREGVSDAPSYIHTGDRRPLSHHYSTRDGRDDGSSSGSAVRPMSTGVIRGNGRGSRPAPNTHTMPSDHLTNADSLQDNLASMKNDANLPQDSYEMVDTSHHPPPHIHHHPTHTSPNASRHRPYTSHTQDESIEPPAGSGYESNTSNSQGYNHGEWSL